MKQNPSSSGPFTPKLERLLDARQVARRLAVSDRTVRNFARSGELPAVKIGPKLWRFREGDVAEYVNSRRSRHADWTY
jgi:excisionase family DNA binding protein